MILHISFVLATLSGGTCTIGAQESSAAPQAARVRSESELTSSQTISVKILVDEEEPGTQRVWEERLRKRVQAASQILQRQCQLKLEVVDVGTWESENRISDFRALLHDFERKVSPHPARLAIGFTSQRLSSLECPQLGTTRGALHSHILIREWFGRTEPERLEVLLHELGHYLGAAHSADMDSVMRPRLGDGKAVSRKFNIGFDSLNALIISIIAEQIRSRDLKGMRELQADTREQLKAVYVELAQNLPSDPVATAYVNWLNDGSTRDVPTPRSSPRSEATRQVVAAIVEAAQQNQQRLARPAASAEPPLTGDRLTEYYFRHAAARAAQLPREHSVPAYLLALAIALDTSDLLRTNDLTRQFWQVVESDAERRHRMSVIGLPTMQTRHDLLQHFVVSSALTVLTGPQIAEAAGIIKELNDANGGSGFSFADLTADLAGISFATQLQAQLTQLPPLADAFTVADHIPPVEGLREGISRERLQADYGSPSDPRFLAERAAILERIRALPGSKASE